MIVHIAVPAVGFLVVLSGCVDRAGRMAALQDNYSSESSPIGIVAPSAESSSLKLPAQPTLADYLAYAALNNQALEAAFNRWKAALEEVPQVEAFPDPRFTYRYYIREVETRVGPQRNSLALAQTLPWFGKLKVRGRAATEAANAARQRYEAEKLSLFRQVKDAYYEYYYLARAISITQENIRLLQSLESVVRARYRAGTATHPDLIRLQVELGKLEDRLGNLKDMRQPVAASLNAVLNLPIDRELPWPSEIKPAGATFTDDKLVSWAIESNPKLKALDANIAQRKEQIDLAKKGYYPDVTVGLTWIDTADRIGRPRPGDSGTDPLMAMVSVNVPLWWGKLKSAVSQARLKHIAALHEKAQAANALGAEIKLATYRFRDAQRRIDLYGRVLIPRTRELLKVTEAAYRGGSASFFDLIDAERSLLEFQLARERALADRAQRLAKLEMLVGRELPRTASSPPGAATRPSSE